MFAVQELQSENEIVSLLCGVFVIVLTSWWLQAKQAIVTVAQSVSLAA